MKKVEDGRLKNYTVNSAMNHHSSSSLLIQGVETYDELLLDWCLDNMQPPTELPGDCIPHLLNYLSGKFWVFSDQVALIWMKSVILHNKAAISQDAESKRVLEDLKAKLKAKSECMEDIMLLRDRLEISLAMPSGGNEFLVEPTPKHTVGNHKWLESSWRVIFRVHRECKIMVTQK